MYFWNAYPFVRLTIAMILGIIAFDQSPSLWEHQLSTFLGLLLSLVFLSLISNRLGFYKLRHLTGLLSLLMIAFTGGYMTKEKYHNHPDGHYLFENEPIHAFQGLIVNTPNERNKYFKYELDLTHVVGDSLKTAGGIILLYIKKDSTSKPFAYGDLLRVHGSFYPISPPGNPHEFDYEKYLKRQNIYAQAFVAHDRVQKVGNQPPSKILQLAYRLRKSASEITDKIIPNQQENAIAKALILGVKDDLDNDIKETYATTGSMHILAVSGLHVGIIYLLVQALFSRLKQHSRLGKRVFVVLSMLLIWLYAMMTGLSPSVLRAATMFSMVSMGDLNARRGNIYNTLGVSAFILLLFDPYLIYSVGFQLSYAAVLGIVYLQPRLYRLITCNPIILDKAWSITCVSIAAQLATLPLSAHYFHQFPTYFLVSNLLAIPAAFLSLLLGILMLLVYPLFNPLGEAIGFILEKTFSLLNEAMERIENLPYALIDWIFIDTPQVVCIYSFMLSLVIGLQFKSFKTMAISTIFFVSLIGISLKQHHHGLDNEKLIFYQIKDQIAIDVVDGKSANLLIADGEMEDMQAYASRINPNRLANHLLPVQENYFSVADKFERIGAFRLGILLNKKILIFDSTTFHLEFTAPIHSDVVLIENDAVKSLEWFTRHFNTKHILLGNTNSFAYLKKMQQQAASIKIEVHSITEEGAFILETSHKKRANHWLALFTTNPD